MAIRPDPGTASWAAQRAVAGSLVTSTAALWRYGLGNALLDGPGRPYLVVPDGWRGTAPRGVRVTRSGRCLDRGRRIGGLSLVRPGIAVIQALSDGVPGAPAVLDRGLQVGRVTLAGMVAEVEASAGSRGVVRARDVVAAAADGAASVAERRLGQLLTRAGAAGMHRNLRVGSAVADLVSRRHGWSSRSTAGPGTAIPPGSAVTGPGRTCWPWLAGPCCGSAGGTSTRNRTGASPTSCAPWPEPVERPAEATDRSRPAGERGPVSGRSDRHVGPKSFGDRAQGREEVHQPPAAVRRSLA